MQFPLKCGRVEAYHIKTPGNALANARAPTFELKCSTCERCLIVFYRRLRHGRLKLKYFVNGLKEGIYGACPLRRRACASCRES